MKLDKYHIVFCDSNEALKDARKNGLPINATIYSSSPALLTENKNNKYVFNIENNWKKNDLDQFQNTIKSFINKTFYLSGKNKYYSLIVGNTMLKFQRFIYSAACLKKIDTTDNILFIKVVSSDKSANLNSINAPWDILLENNNNFDVYNYELTDINWEHDTEKGIPFYKRIYIAGFETFIFRLMSLKIVYYLSSIVCKFIKCREVLIPNDNELLIETAYNLIKKGVLINKISVENFSNSENVFTDEMFHTLPGIKDALRSRLKKWVEPTLIEKCIDVFCIQLELSLNQVSNYRKGWENAILDSNNMRKLLFINAPSNLRGIALTSLCKNTNIPVISFQHGVSQEICKTHGDMAIHYESNYADITFAYNDKSSEIYMNSYFLPQKSISVGMSARHMRMNINSLYKSNDSIIYVSTNLYKGNTGLFIDRQSDYDSYINEHSLLSKVFSKMPHKIVYKPYPEVKRRYVDDDPILKEIEKLDNISLFKGKTDMRYSIAKYKILITSKATSTLSWLIMSKKPVIFINWEKNMPLTDEAYSCFEKSLFLFSPDSDGFDNILEFLSKPLFEIEKLWEEKLKYRDNMIKLFFSSHGKDAGRRASDYIYKTFL